MSEWKLVPVEPTLEMLVAGGVHMTCCSRDVYNSMLDIAPTPPAVDMERDGLLTTAQRLVEIYRKMREPDWHFESIRDMQREANQLEDAIAKEEGK